MASFSYKPSGTPEEDLNFKKFSVGNMLPDPPRGSILHTLLSMIDFPPNKKSCMNPGILQSCTCTCTRIILYPVT